MNKYFIYIYILQLGYFPSFEKRRGKEICLKNILSLRYFIFISIILINRNNNTLLYFY